MLRLLALFLFTVVGFADESPRPPDPLYEKRVVHDRNGIGKFFLGREIAHVMGHQAAGWLERPEREQEERTDLLLEALNLKPGENVADIGCGTGYFAERMAKKVAPDGVVYGVDIQQEMHDLLLNGGSQIYRFVKQFKSLGERVRGVDEEKLSARERKQQAYQKRLEKYDPAQSQEDIQKLQQKLQHQKQLRRDLAKKARAELSAED